jgi:23S rRNA (uracil1939-C5)-methyltransferase
MKPNCEFFVGDMKVVFNDDLSRTHNLMLSSLIHLVTECKDVIEQIMKIAPAKVVYVSCNWLHKLEI